MQILTQLKNKNTVFVGLILLVAAFLRLYMIRDYMIFLGDEGRDVLTAYGILHGHLTLLGPTASVGGFFFGPLYFYLISPFLWFAHYDPVGPAIMVAVFGIATVFLVYKMGRVFFDSPTAILGSFIYAINAYTVVFSRSSWNPHLVPFFAILTALSLLSAVLKNKNLFFVLSGFLYGLTFELHYVTLFFAVAMVLFMVLTTQTKGFTSLIRVFFMRIVLWGIGFIIGISPILAFEVRHGFLNTKNLITFIFFSKDTGGSLNVFPTIGETFARIFTRGVFGLPDPEQMKHFSSLVIGLWSGLGIIVGIAAVGLFIYKFYVLRKSNDTENYFKHLMLLLWLGCGVILFGFYKKSIYEYYFEFLFPISILLTASLFVFLAKKSKVLLGMITMFVGLTVYLNVTQYPFHYPPNEQVDQTKLIADHVLQLSNKQPYNFALITGGNSDQAYRYFLTLAGHPPITLETPATDPDRKTVMPQLIVVCESLPCAPLGYPLWEVAGFGRADIVTKESVSVVEIYKLKHYTQ